MTLTAPPYACIGGARCARLMDAAPLAGSADVPDAGRWGMRSRWKNAGFVLLLVLLLYLILRFVSC